MALCAPAACCGEGLGHAMSLASHIATMVALILLMLPQSSSNRRHVLKVPLSSPHSELLRARRATDCVHSGVANTARTRGTPTRQIKEPPRQEKGSPYYDLSSPWDENHGEEDRMRWQLFVLGDISRPKCHSGPIRICQYGRGKTLLRFPETVQIRALTLPRKVV